MKTEELFLNFFLEEIKRKRKIKRENFEICLRCLWETVFCLRFPQQFNGAETFSPAFTADVLVSEEKIQKRNGFQYEFPMKNEAFNYWNYDGVWLLFLFPSWVIHRSVSSEHLLVSSGRQLPHIDRHHQQIDITKTINQISVDLRSFERLPPRWSIHL